MAHVVLPAAASWCEDDARSPRASGACARAKGLRSPDSPGGSRVVSSSESVSARLSASPSRNGCGNELRSLSPGTGDSSGCSKSSAACVAVPGLVHPEARSSTEPLASRRKARRRRSMPSSRAAVDKLPKTFRSADDRAPPHSFNTACRRPVQLAAAPRETLTSLSRTASGFRLRGEPSARSRAGARSRARPLLLDSAAGASFIPCTFRTRWRQHPDDRRHRPQVRHGGVQGLGDKNREGDRDAGVAGRRGHPETP